MLRYASTLGAIAVILFASSAYAIGDIVFSNPYDPDGDNGWSSSSNEMGDVIHNQCFADYYWQDEFYMTDFHWWGTSFGSLDDIVGFTFQIWSHDDATGKPLSILYEEYFAGNAGAMFVETNSSYNLDVYKYGIDLSTPFMPAAPGYYWFSVLGHSNTTGWYWVPGQNATWNEDWQHVFVSYSNARWDNTPDFAYEITADVIPEPATLLLFGLGLMGLAARRMRK